MINIATLCDKNYLLKGLALRQSLIELNVDFKIFWLCLDFETKEKLIKLNDSRLMLFSLDALEEQDEQLRKAKENPPSRYGSQRDNYIWALTPYFVNLILERNFIRRNEYLMYVDSDIYFYHSPQVILDTIAGKSIGIHTHRFGPTRKKLDVGWYNVGVTVFKKDEVGMRMAEQWKSWLLDTTNPYYQEYGTCGDQKYLELFRPLAGKINVCVFDERTNISHRAPWCCDEDNKLVVFFHFSHFNYSTDLSLWSDSIHGEWKPAQHKHIRPYYEKYFEVIKQVSKLIQ